MSEPLEVIAHIVGVIAFIVGLGLIEAFLLARFFIWRGWWR